MSRSYCSIGRSMFCKPFPALVVLSAPIASVKPTDSQLLIVAPKSARSEVRELSETVLLGDNSGAAPGPEVHVVSQCICTIM
ncbi:hypothetical protein BD311DRAFT_771771 [Dichomitus squalens]|uniref:Uncharacterized protein n=1 Tax=Dichomitus squalens TaxID=114155 RepID=A0A4Q9M747_9APHY|nr:hypothetical protein BD311DRAFT_771771 [Dichomitus squalens]